jgi:hypothetical protein
MKGTIVGNPSILKVMPQITNLSTEMANQELVGTRRPLAWTQGARMLVEWVLAFRNQVWTEGAHMLVEWIQV